jgi:hypothetical protein
MVAQVVELGSNAPCPPFRCTPLKGQQHIVRVFDEGVKTARACLPGCFLAVRV